jgi:hypothetical protein
MNPYLLVLTCLSDDAKKWCKKRKAITEYVTDYLNPQSNKDKVWADATCACNLARGVVELHPRNRRHFSKGLGKHHIAICWTCGEVGQED